MRIFRSAGFIVILAFLLGGCGMDKNIKDCVTEGAANGQLSVHVSCGDPQSRPIYTWSDINNDTTAMEVKVARTLAIGTIVWAVSSLNPSLNSVQSPIQHETTQSGTTQTANSEPDLTPNVSYRVTVTKVDGTFGYREFTIQP